MESPVGSSKVRYQSLIFGLMSLPVGIAVGLYVAMDSTAGTGYEYFYVFAALAALLMSWFLWWLIIQRPGKPSKRRAVSVGVLSGLLSHWLCWYLFLLWSNVDYWLLGASGSSLGEAPMDPLIGLVGVLVFTFFSWLFLGWLTVGASLLIALWWSSRIRAALPASDQP